MLRKAAVFDMDGTLVDSRDLAVGAAHDGLREHFGRRGEPVLLPPASQIAAAVGLPSLEYFAALLPSGRRAEAAELRAHVIESELRRLATGEGRLFPNALQTLAALRRGGWALALVSNCGRAYFDANLRHLGLGPAFDVALCLDDGPDKPANVREALRRLGADGGVMLGDRSADIQAGRSAGLRTIACRYGFGTSEEWVGADHRIDALAEVLPLLEGVG